MSHKNKQQKNNKKQTKENDSIITHGIKKHSDFYPHYLIIIMNIKIQIKFIYFISNYNCSNNDKKRQQMLATFANKQKKLWQ